MFFYRILFFSYAIDLLIRLFPKLILIIGYLFCAGILTIWIASWSSSTALYAIQNPGWTFKYMYKYAIWLFGYRSTFTLGEFTKIFVAFTTPYFCIVFGKKFIFYLARLSSVFLKKSAKTAFDMLRDQFKRLKIKLKNKIKTVSTGAKQKDFTQPNKQKKQSTNYGCMQSGNYEQRQLKNRSRHT